MAPTTHSPFALCFVFVHNKLNENVTRTAVIQTRIRQRSVKRMVESWNNLKVTFFAKLNIYNVKINVGRRVGAG